MQTMLTFIRVEHASLQPVLTTLSRCGTSDPIRCYSTTKVKTPEKLDKRSVQFTFISKPSAKQNHNSRSTTVYLWLMYWDVAGILKHLLNHLLHFFMDCSQLSPAYSCYINKTTQVSFSDFNSTTGSLTRWKHHGPVFVLGRKMSWAYN